MDQKTALKLMRKAGELVQAGKGREARKSLDKVLKAFPGQPDALHLSGLAWMQEGRLDAAEKLIRQASTQRPQEAGYLANLALVRLRADKPAEAAEAARAALRLQPRHGAALDTLARAAVRMDETETALDALRRLHALAPQSPGPLIGLGDLQRRMGAATAAADAYRQALSRAPDSLPALLGLADLPPPAVFAPEALAAMKKAAALVPDDADLAGRLALFLEQANQLKAARAEADRALSLDPTQANARLCLGRLALRDGDLAGATENLAAIPEATLPAESAAQVSWLQAQIADRSGDTAAAASAMERAHALRRTLPEVQAVRRTVLEERAAGFRALLADRPAPTRQAVDPAQPVFFVGYPRSGTTLMEQILAAHPALVTTAEEPFLARVLMDLPQLIGRPYRHPQDLPTLTDAEAARAAAHYLKIAEASLGPLEGQRIVDKLPLNLVELPFVERLFPGAAVLVALRDPRDVVLSNVMQLFAPNPASIHSDSIEGCAAAYALVMDLWETYQEALALPHLVYRYEDLVTDFEGTVRTVIDFLGLPWDDGLRDYTAQAATRHIQTPSYTRAAARPDTASVGRWERYRDWLAPALPVLAPFAERYGYATAS